MYVGVQPGLGGGGQTRVEAAAGCKAIWGRMKSPSVAGAGSGAEFGAEHQEPIILQ